MEMGLARCRRGEGSIEPVVEHTPVGIPAALPPERAGLLSGDGTVHAISADHSCARTFT